MEEIDPFPDEKSLIDNIVTSAGPDDRIAIMAGHFMLLYDESNNQLAPMIIEDDPSRQVRNHTETMAGDFPLRTFRCGLDLLQRLKGHCDEVKLALLVNDHKFTDENFQPWARDVVERDAGALRKAFYRRELTLPVSYSAELDRRELTTGQVIQSNSTATGGAEAILPNGSIYYSEMHLRNRFNRRARTDLRNNKDFELTRARTPIAEGFADEGYYDIRFYDEDGRLCHLTEMGGCGCSGEMVQFFDDLSADGFTHVVVMTPNECILPVSDAAYVAVRLMHSQKNRPLKIQVIHGMGGMVRREENIKSKVYVSADNKNYQ